MKPDIQYLDATSSEELINTHEKHLTEEHQDTQETNTEAHQGIQPVYLVAEDRYARV